LVNFTSSLAGRYLQETVDEGLP
jgi:uncharacterized membrane protein YfcA